MATWQSGVPSDSNSTPKDVNRNRKMEYVTRIVFKSIKISFQANWVSSSRKLANFCGYGLKNLDVLFGEMRPGFSTTFAIDEELVEKINSHWCEIRYVITATSSLLLPN